MNQHLTHHDYCSIECMRAHADEYRRLWLGLNKRINSELIERGTKPFDPHALGGDE